DSRHARSKRAFVARLVAVERGGAKVLFMVEPAGDRGAAAACHDTKDTSMRSTCFYPFVLSLSKDDDRCGSTKPVLSLPKGSPRTVTSNRSNYSAWRITRALLVATVACAAAPVLAQPAPPPQPTVTVTASATATIANDRLQAWLRAEAENASAGAAASQVNATIGKALAEAKTHPSIKVATAGYSTQQISDKVRAQRWRVVQTISLEGSDFASAAALISRLQ